ncbi:MAG: cation:proton antiporter [Chloroflexota bacterium]
MLQVATTTSSVEETVIQVAWLLVGAAIIGVASYKLGIPYAVALVLAGVAVGQLAPEKLPGIDPEVVLFVFLPPLLFDAAFRIDARLLRKLLRPVLYLAVFGTLITAGIVALLLVVVLGMPVPIALLFGSIVASTDPVAVVAIVQKLGLPHRLAIVLEGESLVNDGIAVVLYTLFTALVVTGSLDGANPAMLFAQEVGGGLIVGAVLALVAVSLTASISDHLVEMIITVALAYGSYLLANSVHASGPLACVVAGIIHGSYGRTFGMSAATSSLLDDLWEFLGFIANAMLFLMVGFSVEIREVADDLWPAVIAVAAVLVARFVVVQFGGVLGKLINRPVPQNTLGLFMWTGLRGALTIALALGVPEGIPYRGQLVDMAFAVVLFTLIVQGLTLPWVVGRLNIKEEEHEVHAHA